MESPNSEYSAEYFTLSNGSQSFVTFAELRKTIFVDQERWKLPLDDGLEIDQFDHYWAHYCLLHINGKPIGGFRAIRTDKPFLLQEKFLFLEPPQGFPRNQTTWEISRFGVAKTAPKIAGQTLYSMMFDFANKVHADKLIALTDLKHERLLRLMKIRTNRYCEPRCIGLDMNENELIAVAGEIPITSQQHLNKTIKHTLEKVSINDQRHVFRSHFISA